MLESVKKVFVFLLLLLISTSFSGCLGIGLPTTMTSNKSSSNQNVANTDNDSQGVFKTTDGGKTWEHKITIEGSDLRLDQIKIRSMAIDPQNHDVLYLGTLGDGLYKTENGADSWTKVEDENGLLSSTANIYSIAVEDGNSNIIYLATLNEKRGVLFKTEDGGKKWERVYISSQADKAIPMVQIDRNNKNIIYIGTSQGGLLKSENRGKDWVAIRWFESGVKSFVVDFTNPQGMLVLTYKAVHKTVDGGASWVDLNEKVEKGSGVKNIEFGDVSSMTIDNKNPLVIYITYVNLVIITRDGGDTWKRLNTITPARTAVDTIPNVRQIGMIDDIIYYGAGNALYKSDNKGDTWSSMDIPILGDAQYTVSDFSNSDIIYVGTFYNPPAKK